MVVVVMRIRASLGPTSGMGLSASSIRPGSTNTAALIISAMEHLLTGNREQPSARSRVLSTVHPTRSGVLIRINNGRPIRATHRHWSECLQLGVGHHQPLAAFIVEVDLDARLGAVAFVVEHHPFAEQRVHHPLAEGEAGALGGFLAEHGALAPAGAEGTADLVAQTHFADQL